jgi:hypothetical protein
MVELLNTFLCEEIGDDVQSKRNVIRQADNYCLLVQYRLQRKRLKECFTSADLNPIPSMQSARHWGTPI